MSSTNPFMKVFVQVISLAKGKWVVDRRRKSNNMLLGEASQDFGRNCKLLSGIHF